MKSDYDKGVAFVFEGDTEKYFYVALLEYFCKLHKDYVLERVVDEKSGDIFYELNNNLHSVLIRMNCVGTVTQITHSSNWFNNVCARKYPKIGWDVFLCYDTDDYTQDISKFQAGDWKNLRSSIAHRQNISIIDMAASADIEDLFLCDLHGIEVYLEASEAISEINLPTGRKGKVKIKQLFRQHSKYYHEGRRAVPLIYALDMSRLINAKLLPLEKIEESCFL